MSDLPTASPEARVLLIACYELGHQPLSLAWPLACLRQAGMDAATLDLAVEPFDPARASAATFTGIAVPMHTALRLGLQAARRVRAANPNTHICFFGLYAWLNRDYLLANGGDSVIGGEVEEPLVRLIGGLARGASAQGVPGVSTLQSDSDPYLGRVKLPVPERAGLPELERYAHYIDGSQARRAGYVESSRGCLHTCRHCPIVPVYNGRFFAVPAEVVLEDIRRQVAAGAGHITFGDPDFLNGPGHAVRLTRSLHAEFPKLTYNFTTKVEHILQHRDLFAEFARLGCTFITTAVESVSERVLERLAKGHTAADIDTALTILDAAGIAMQPTLVAFTPWTTLDDYLAQIEFIHERGLQSHIAPVQLSIRLLLPPGSPLLEMPDASEWLGELDGANFSYRWRHPDPRMDRLYALVSERVMWAEANAEPAELTHRAIGELAYAAAGQPVPARVAGQRAAAGRCCESVPRLTENWFCCAEPTQGQVDLLQI